MQHPERSVYNLESLKIAGQVSEQVHRSHGSVANISTGWKMAQICTYGALPILPEASVLQYAIECFEGIKVCRAYDGIEIRILDVANGFPRLRRVQRFSLDYSSTNIIASRVRICQYH
ncbi:hypothetical protein BJX96DRAFT_44536 [Aspergillus floccosus]